MNFRSISLFCVFFVAIFYMESCDNTNKGLTVSASVTFGVQPPGGGACAGRGLCTSISSTNPTPPAEAIPVNFSLDAADRSMLLLTYKMADLQIKQPLEAAFIRSITAPSAPQPAVYKFDAPCSLTVPLYSSLNLLGGAKITPMTPITVTTDGTTVVLHIKYEHL